MGPMLNRLIAIGMASPGLRVFLNAIHIRSIAAMWLRRFPLRRRVIDTALSYRVTSLDNLIVAREVFAQGEYDALNEFHDIRSFADLGCNCGYFTLLAASLGNPETIFGLAIDAHPEMVEASRWHIVENRLLHVEALWGLLGSNDGDGGRFFLNIDAAGSSRFDRAPKGNVTRNPWREIVAPVISLAAEWERRFGESPCDVLKIDIEGSEAALLSAEADFLSRVSLLIVEMHKWIVNVDDLQAFLDVRGFALYRVLRSNQAVHVVLFIRRGSRYSSRLPLG